MSVLRWIEYTCLLMFCAALVGCGAYGESAGEPSESEAADAAAESSAQSQSDATALTTFDPALDRKAARVSFIRRDQATSKFPGTKLNEAIFEYKLYSDDSVELDGKYTEFWSDGQSKFVDGEYKDNVRSGTRRYYHGNGGLAREVRFVNGQPDGSWIRFREDGSKEMEVSYKNGKKDGVWKFYTLVESEKTTDAKKPSDAVKEKSKDDSKESPKSAAAKPEAKVDDKKAPPAVRLASEGSFKEGRRDGLWITYHPNGQKAAETNVKGDRRDGKETTWYASGKKMLEAEYQNGLPHGVATMWNEQGDVILRREYKDGKLIPKSAKGTDQAAN
jgi:antitoxin component YwqK of YwqJK toxin-antitoxin module